MEIDLTAVWEAVSAPVRIILSPFQRRARRSRRRAAAKGPVGSRLAWIRLARTAAILSLGGVFLGVIGFFVMFAWFSRDLPEPGKIVRREGFSTRLLDRNGQLLYDLYQEERRVPISITDVPEYLKNATVAIEDKDFYKHGGFDPLTPFRIIYNIIFRRGRVVGGSTLTQQLVKNVLLTNERTLQRKFKEFVLAIQIERKFTKDQILEMYLNEAPYGGNASGVGAAAEQYFGKKVQDLSLVEAAILAGLPQRPTAYSPHFGKTDVDGVPLWKLRTFGVLRRMHDDKYVTSEEYETALKDLDSVEFTDPKTTLTAPHFVFYVSELLEDQFGEQVMARGGLNVTTSLDLGLQESAQNIVAEEIEKVQGFHITNGSAMAMDPKTGEILAMIGSADYNNEEIGGKFNVAVDGLRQPGSSIKPVTYLAMLQRGFTPATVLADVPTTFQRNDAEKPYQPNNYDGKFRGPVSVRNSLGSSLNVPAVKSLATVGIDNFLQLAYNMGFDTLEPSDENMKRFGLAVTLGGAEVHLIDTVSAYSAFANGGTRVEPTAILKVEDQSGRKVFEYRPVPGQRVMSEQESFLINDILSDNNARLMAFGANSLLNTGRPIAVKTGTTNDQRDNWTIGWSQDIIVGTWVGNNDNSAMTKVASGVTGASPIWRRIILDALDRGYGVPSWVVPDGIEQIDVDVVSGYPAHDGYPSKKEYVIRGTVPGLPDPVHTKLKLCRGEFKLATDAKIAAGDYDEREFIVLQENDPFSQDGKNRWQEAISAWAAGQEEKYRPPTEYCGENTDVFVELKKPENEKKYNDTNIEFEVRSDSGDGIEKVEIVIDGSVKKTVEGNYFKEFLDVPKGRHEIYVKAYSRSGKTATTGTIRIGTGGEDWKAPDPSPTPSPSPVIPSPSPSPSPTPTP